MKNNKKLKLISIMSRKGGVGKSTIALAIALALAKRKKVVLLDLDTIAPMQMFISKFKFKEEDLDLGTWIAEDRHVDQVKEMEIDLNLNNPPPDNKLPKIMVMKSTLWILERINRMQMNNPGATFLAARLRSLFRRLEEMGYEYAVIDNGPGLFHFRFFMLHFLRSYIEHDADFLICTTPDKSDVAGLVYEYDMIKTLFSDEPERRSFWILNRFDPKLENQPSYLDQKSIFEAMMAEKLLAEIMTTRFPTMTFNWIESFPPALILPEWEYYRGMKSLRSKDAPVEDRKIDYNKFTGENDAADKNMETFFTGIKKFVSQKYG